MEIHSPGCHKTKQYIYSYLVLCNAFCLNKPFIPKNNTWLYPSAIHTLQSRDYHGYLMGGNNLVNNHITNLLWRTTMETSLWAFLCFYPFEHFMSIVVE